MSNAMSRSKSRWKGALLATVAGAAIAPIAAKAQNMKVGLYLAPPGGSSPQQLQYLDPDYNNTDIPVYVYATVTGVQTLTSVSGTTAAVISTGEFDGLQYLYYNVNASSGTLGGVAGGIDAVNAPTLNSALGFNATASNGSGGGFGSQVGTVQLNSLSSALGANTSVLALGANLNLSGGVVTSSNVTDFAKPRSASAVWSDYATYNSSAGGSYTYKNDGKNIIVGSNSVSFLVETINYKPTAFTASASSSSLTSTTLSAIAPTAALTTFGLTPSNYFTDSTSSLPGMQYNATGGSLSPNTKSAYTAALSGLGTVTFTDTIPGDCTGDVTAGVPDGKVDSADLAVVVHFFGSPTTLWSQGDFDGTGTVDSQDLADVVHFFNSNIGPVPSSIVAPAALLDNPEAVELLESAGITPVAAVPEPASLSVVGLLGAATLLRRRRV